MPSLQSLRQKIASVKNTQKITKAMNKKVTLFYSKTRQAAMTNELMDIVGGAEALK